MSEGKETASPVESSTEDSESDDEEDQRQTSKNADDHAHQKTKRHVAKAAKTAKAPKKNVGKNGASKRKEKLTQRRMTVADGLNGAMQKSGSDQRLVDSSGADMQDTPHGVTPSRESSADVKGTRAALTSRSPDSVMRESAMQVQRSSVEVGSKSSLSSVVDAKLAGKKWKKAAKENATTTSAATAAEAEIMEAAGKEAPFRRQRGSEVINPTVDGMRHFGISKGVISRAIVKFSSAPEPHPLTLCFHFPGTFLTHKYVLEMVRGKIDAVEESRVTAIQFIDRNTIHGTQGLDNRWLVTLNSREAMDLLVRHGLHLFNRKIMLRHYDDILNDEYREYQQYIELHRKLYAKEKQEGDDPAAAQSGTDGAEQTDGLQQPIADLDAEMFVEADKEMDKLWTQLKPLQEHKDEEEDAEIMDLQTS